MPSTPPSASSGTVPPSSGIGVYPPVGIDPDTCVGAESIYHSNEFIIST